MIDRDWTSIDELVAKHEADPKMRPYIIAARKKLAPILFPDGGPHYERLMRGEGPSDLDPGEDHASR